MQKVLKRGQYGSSKDGTGGDDYVMVSLLVSSKWCCALCSTASGGFRHNKREQSVELQIKRSSCYDDFAFKAATTLNLQPLPCSSIHLFKVCDGAIILGEDIVVQGKTRRWTVGVTTENKFKFCADWTLDFGHCYHNDDSSAFSISLPSSGILDK